MDLKSMLNEATAAAPHPSIPPTPAAEPLHQPTRHQTYPPLPGTLTSSTATYEASHSERPSQPAALRVPGSRSSSAGYDSAQSPSRHTFASNSSLHSGGGLHPGLGQSPAQNQAAATRDGPLYNHHTIAADNGNKVHSGAFVSSPSHSSPPSQQATGLQGQYQPGQPAALPTIPSTPTLGGSRESPVGLNGLPHPSARHISPRSVTFHKPSTQSPHPTSAHGLNHTSSHSGGSFGSAHGLESGDRPLSHYQQSTGRESLTRHFVYERERETSMSVSPKTIPQPSPLQNPSGTDKPQLRMTTSPPRRSVSSNTEPTHLVSSVEAGAQPGPLSSFATSKILDRSSSPYSSRNQSPTSVRQYSTPPSRSAMAPTRASPAAAHRQPLLKRTASAIIDASSSPQPCRKRLKAAEVPVFARNARPNKPPLKLMTRDHVRAAPQGAGTVNGHSRDLSTVEAPSVASMVAPPEPGDWEPSIMGSTPYEELTRYICDAIYGTIGSAEPPTDGAVFEIEAKLGEIHNVEEGRRLRLPVMTETVFDKGHFGSPTRFESSMNVEQHRALNSYLNNLCAESQEPPRTPMFYDHPRETDAFYSLTPSGEATLSPSIRKHLNPKHRPRVRVTTSPGHGGGPPAVKRRIIKSRIADLDVHCPSLAFDYRISISVESPYDGPDDVLVKVNDAGAAAAGSGGDREKDRVSYRHLAYQIDLTQVSYPNTNQREHELEIEISTEIVRQELTNLREGRPSRYEDLVRGFVDNVRILARRGTLPMRR